MSLVNSQVQRSAAEMKQRMEEHAQRAQELHSELVSAHRELQESKVRESSYREQLTRSLTSAKLIQAELIEAKQQATSGSAQAFQWRNANKESDLSLAAAETAVRIARDEIVMLEHHVKRVERENVELKNELQRADRLVYGAHIGSNNTLPAAAAFDAKVSTLSS